MRCVAHLHRRAAAVLGWARGAWARLLSGIAALGHGLAYRRQELLVVALLAISVLGGFAVELWHHRAPGLLDRLEAEPPRLAALARTPGPRPRGEPSPGRDGPRARAAPPARAGPAKAEPRLTPVVVPPSPEHPLDLNGATAVELSGLPGVGPRLAARILARRTELGGRFASVTELASVPGLGARKAGLLRALVHVASPPDGPESRGTGETRDTSAADPEAAGTSPPPEPEVEPGLP
jgi:hypothetical protein